MTSDEANKAPDRLLSILVPVHNERPYLRRLVERALAASLPDGLDREIILIDDASTDGSAELARELEARHPNTVRAFGQATNQGKGAAIRRAIAEMRGQYALFQDGNLEYDPEDYAVLIRPLLDGHADVVYGSRFASAPMRRVFSYRLSLGARALTHLSNLFTGLNLTDMLTGYKAFRADVLRTISLRSNRLGLEPEITAKIAKRGCAVYETPVSYHGRAYAEGKRIKWGSGLSVLLTILKYWVLDDCYEERYGHAILGDLARARHFSRWVADVIEPYMGRRILEVGAGIGNISRFLPKRERLTLTDHDPVYLKMLSETYQDNDLIDVAPLDLTRDDDLPRLGQGAYDTVVCLNVLEHIKDDRTALRRMRRLLRPGGKLLLLAPQYRRLYGSYDRKLGHHRRYDRKEIVALLGECGYRVKKTRNFNALAIVGWWLNSCLLRRSDMGKFQIKAFDTFVPVLRPIEALLPLPGLSLICVAEALEAESA